MSFLTAQEMFNALSEQIDDEDFVMRTVRTAFPAWKREQEARFVVLQPVTAKRPVPENIDEIRTHRSIEQGSRDLLMALHREHPRIMRALADQGRQVVYP